MFKFSVAKGLSQRGTWKSALLFSTLEILFRICPYKGCRVGLTATAPEALKFFLGVEWQAGFRLMAAMGKKANVWPLYRPKFQRKPAD